MAIIQWDFHALRVYFLVSNLLWNSSHSHKNAFIWHTAIAIASYMNLKFSHIQKSAHILWDYNNVSCKSASESLERKLVRWWLAAGFSSNIHYVKFSYNSNIRFNLHNYTAAGGYCRYATTDYYTPPLPSFSIHIIILLGAKRPFSEPAPSALNVYGIDGIWTLEKFIFLYRKKQDAKIMSTSKRW